MSSIISCGTVFKVSKMVLTFECLDEMINYNLLNERYPVESSGVAIYIIKRF